MGWPMYFWLALIGCLAYGKDHETNREKRDVITGFDPITARDMVVHSLNLAYKELQDELSLNSFLFRTGVDTRMSESYTRVHGNFRMMMGNSRELADHGFCIARGTQELTRLTKMTVPQLRSSPMFVKLWRKQIAPFCTPNIPKCHHGRSFRTDDGSCNNLRFSTWGMGMKPQLRWLPPAYLDGIDIPRIMSVTGKPLPSPRTVSNIVHNTHQCKIEDPRISAMHMQWGQFLDHDLGLTPTLKGDQDSDMECCNITKELLMKRPGCFPITVPPEDGHFRKPCMNFVRSTPSTNDFCDLGPREQLNQATSYIDSSQIYGISDEARQRIRVFKDGRIGMRPDGILVPGPISCTIEKKGDFCFDSGDPRVHENPTNAVLHTMFVREHNKIASKLGKINPHWNDERIFRETHKIIDAEMQHITYTEYLPIVLGMNTMKAFGLLSTPKGFNTVYYPGLDATLSNVFGVAAFRFGHSQIPEHQGLMPKGYDYAEAVPLEDTYNKPTLVLSNRGCGVGGLARYASTMSAAATDSVIVDAVRDLLFLDRNGDSFDLVALNIQRGRDHGVPGYNAWRKFCGLKTAIHMAPGPGGLIDHTPEKAKLLSKVYRHPDDIDIFTGGISEIPISGALVGPTFACIIGKQFHNLKFGDRFWYENAFPKTGFTGAQLHEIKKITLSKVTCSNLEIDAIQPNIFVKPLDENARVPCTSLPGMDLSAWKELGGWGNNWGHYVSPLY